MSARPDRGVAPMAITVHALVGVRGDQSREPQRHPPPQPIRNLARSLEDDTIAILPSPGGVPLSDLWQQARQAYRGQPCRRCQVERQGMPATNPATTNPAASATDPAAPGAG